MPRKTEAQAFLFANRLLKRSLHLKKWARRAGLSSYRLYDRDIPEIPLCADLYESLTGRQYLVLFLYERPYEKPEKEEALWLVAMKETAQNTLNLPAESVFIKLRRRQRMRQARQQRYPAQDGKNTGQTDEKTRGQYKKLSDADFWITIAEQEQKFLINLSSYLDTGLFFDHRPLRLQVRSLAENKTVLNLFCYTGSFSIYAAAGGAASVHSVDLSKKYLDWAKKNLILNGFTDNSRYPLIQDDVFSFLCKGSQNWDIIILDPPTFSNSKKTANTLDINRDWPVLIDMCFRRLNPKGVLFFSTNSRSLKFDAQKLFQGADLQFSGFQAKITDITKQSLPEDFKNTQIHRCWQIEKNCAVK